MSFKHTLLFSVLITPLISQTMEKPSFKPLDEQCMVFNMPQKSPDLQKRLEKHKFKWAHSAQFKAAFENMNQEIYEYWFQKVNPIVKDLLAKNPQDEDARYAQDLYAALASRERLQSTKSPVSLAVFNQKKRELKGINDSLAYQEERMKDEENIYSRNTDAFGEFLRNLNANKARKKQLLRFFNTESGKEYRDQFNRGMALALLVPKLKSKAQAVTFYNSPDYSPITPDKSVSSCDNQDFCLSIPADASLDVSPIQHATPLSAKSTQSYDPNENRSDSFDRDEYTTPEVARLQSAIDSGFVLKRKRKPIKFSPEARERIRRLSFGSPEQAQQHFDNNDDFATPEAARLEQAIDAGSVSVRKRKPVRVSPEQDLNANESFKTPDYSNIQRAIDSGSISVRKKRAQKKLKFSAAPGKKLDFDAPVSMNDLVQKDLKRNKFSPQKYTEYWNHSIKPLQDMVFAAANEEFMLPSGLIKADGPTIGYPDKVPGARSVAEIKQMRQQLKEIEKELESKKHTRLTSIIPDAPFEDSALVDLWITDATGSNWIYSQCTDLLNINREILDLQKREKKLKALINADPGVKARREFRKEVKELGEYYTQYEQELKKEIMRQKSGNPSTDENQN